MAGQDIIVIGGSTGALEALSRLVRELPEDLAAAVFVVLHLTDCDTGALPRALRRAGPLTAVHPRDGEAIQPGHIYVAPPGRHLVIRKGYVRLGLGPRENGHRPAIDPLFRTAATAYGRRVVAVVLSGCTDDGIAGLMAVKQQGGTIVAQNPREALYPMLPSMAIENVQADHVLPVGEIPALLHQLAGEATGTEAPFAQPSNGEAPPDVAEMDGMLPMRREMPGAPSAFACPECGSTLWEQHEAEFVRYICHAGHVFSLHTLASQQSQLLENAFWNIIRALEQAEGLRHYMAARARQRGDKVQAARYEESALEVRREMERIRDTLLHHRTEALAQ